MSKSTVKHLVTFSVVLAVCLFLISLAGREGEAVVRVEQRTDVWSIVGQCFDNGMNAVGKLIHVKNHLWGMLAFSNGIVASYPFAALEPAICPGGEPVLDREHVLEILKKNANEE